MDFFIVLLEKNPWAYQRSVLGFAWAELDKNRLCKAEGFFGPKLRADISLKKVAIKVTLFLMYD